MGCVQWFCVLCFFFVTSVQTSDTNNKDVQDKAFLGLPDDGFRVQLGGSCVQSAEVMIWKNTEDDKEDTVLIVENWVYDPEWLLVEPSLLDGEEALNIVDTQTSTLAAGDIEEALTTSLLYDPSWYLVENIAGGKFNLKGSYVAV